MQPLEYLAELQRQLNGTHRLREKQALFGMLFCDPQQSTADPAQIQSLLDEALPPRDDLPTPLQNPLTYAILREAMYDVRMVAPHVLGGDHAVRMPLCGSVDAGVFWAASLAVGEKRSVDDTLLLFSSGIFDAAHLLSKILAQNYLLIETNGTYQYEIDPKALESDAVNARFVDFACAYLVRGAPSAADQYFLPPEYDSLTSAFCSSFETFVVAHEYAHIALGHAFSAQAVRTRAGETEVEQLLRRWQDEFAADELAVRLTCAAMRQRGYDEPLSLFGILLCLKTLWLIQQCDALRDGEPVVPVLSTHPNAELRISMLRDFVSGEMGVECTDLVDTVFDALWEKNQHLIGMIYGQVGSIGASEGCAGAQCGGAQTLPQDPFFAIHPSNSLENSLHRARFMLK